jgi:DNA invertase Pin-like site-specific DNA recombinase
MFTVIGTTVTSEREMMLERQRESIAKAKAEGKYNGGNQQHGRKRWDPATVEGWAGTPVGSPHAHSSS